MSSTDNTTDNRFKKNTQTVGANGNDVTATDATLNDSILQSRTEGGEEVSAVPLGDVVSSLRSHTHTHNTPTELYRTTNICQLKDRTRPSREGILYSIY